MIVITAKTIKDMLSTQATLDERVRINLDEEAKKTDQWIAKKIALRVELAEFCNEGQWFKFWKKHREPNTSETDEERMEREPGPWRDWPKRNPLLEEYVDVIHFLLSLGNDMNMDEALDPVPFCKPGTGILAAIDHAFVLFDRIRNRASWMMAFEHFLSIGALIGFRPGDIVMAYYEKNEKNHKRQSEGY